MEITSLRMQDTALSSEGRFVLHDGKNNAAGCPSFLKIHNVISLPWVPVWLRQSLGQTRKQ